MKDVWYVEISFYNLKSDIRIIIKYDFLYDFHRFSSYNDRYIEISESKFSFKFVKWNVNALYSATQNGYAKEESFFS